MTAPTLPRAHVTCRICDSPLMPVLSLGTLHLSDFPRSATSVPAHPAVPLDLARCSATDTCGLVQLVHTTPPGWLYGGTYWYRSGVNETMRAELKDIVHQACARVPLPHHATVIDIGANDGTLLQQYTEVLGKGHPLLTVGYDPSPSHYEALRPHAKVLFPEYFKVGEPWTLKTRARIVTAIAMFYDLDDPHAFVEDLTKVLHPEGAIVIQQAYLPNMLAASDLTNICHEHLEYYHLRPLEALLAQHGLEVVDVELRAINGGSIRTYIQHAGAGTVSPRVAARRAEEDRLLEHADKLFEHFVGRTQSIREQLQAVLGAYHEAGAPVDLYAASTKANTLLQWCGLDARHLRQAWERTPEKWGRHVGMTKIPIVREEEGRLDPPAALLVGGWQFRNAFIQRESEYLALGGSMIFPLPHVETITQSQVRELCGE